MDSLPIRGQSTWRPRCGRCRPRCSPGRRRATRGAVVASLLGLALLPLAFGHTLYNAALRLTSATKVNVVATQELTLGVLWGALLLGEVPSAETLAGAVLTLIGVVLVVL